jgi:hypothetical protein
VLDSTAEYNFTGMFTNPKLIDPVQVLLMAVFKSYKIKTMPCSKVKMETANQA